jgi:glucosamine--fructose-6-phosphate aminotransferase (isomerizing)
MCGIVGYVGPSTAAPLILEGLKQLEYRGYDSAGIATLADGAIARVRAEGKLINLANQLDKNKLSGTTGIGHTRWATHGVPNEQNAHPHATAKVAVVHNGIIENFQPLREEMQARGHQFYSQTDTEVVPVILTDYLAQGKSPIEAVRLTLDRLEGAFALGILFTDLPDTIFCARRGAPLCLGLGDGETFFASDPMAIARHTQRIVYLEDGEWAEVSSSGAQIFDSSHQPVLRDAVITHLGSATAGKGNYAHYMQKEIHEQPGVLGECFSVYVDTLEKRVRLPEMAFPLDKIRQITLIACGTSFYAAQIAQYWLQSLIRLPVTLDIASEFRYREPHFADDGLVICISQSGETADTLAALRMAKAAGQSTMAVVNVQGSTMDREAQQTLLTYAGPEIGVASTKAFTAQLATLGCFALALAEAHPQSSANAEMRHSLLHALVEAPARMLEALHQEDGYLPIADEIAKARDVIYIGRGTSYPLAMEGALKLKEISYIHAEGYAAGELKHGPIALIDDAVPIIAIAPHDHWFEKTLSNIQEAAARGGKIIAITDAQGAKRLADISFATLTVPNISAFAAPLLYALPVQMLAYHVAVKKGTDVDQPRNLAKSVTVE